MALSHPDCRCSLSLIVGGHFWSRDGGDLRAAHFLAIHAMQALPAFVLLVRSVTPVGVGLAACAWIALTTGAYAAAFAGISLSP
jgi:hypothetical protein